MSNTIAQQCRTCTTACRRLPVIAVLAAVAARHRQSSGPSTSPRLGPRSTTTTEAVGASGRSQPARRPRAGRTRRSGAHARMRVRARPAATRGPTSTTCTTWSTAPRSLLTPRPHGPAQRTYRAA